MFTQADIGVQSELLNLGAKLREVSPSTKSSSGCSGDELDASFRSSFSEEDEETFVVNSRRAVCLPSLQVNLKVKNTFLDVGLSLEDELEGPASRQRATSAPPTCNLGSDEEREAPSRREFCPSTPTGSPRAKYEVLAGPVKACAFRFFKIFTEEREEVIPYLRENCLGPDIILHIECRNHTLWSGFAEKDLHGPDEVIQFPAQLRDAIPDLDLNLEDVVNERREGVNPVTLARVTCTGTQRYPFLPMLPSGKQVKFALHMEILDKVNGKPSEMRWSFSPINPVLQMVKEIVAQTRVPTSGALALEDTQSAEAEAKTRGEINVPNASVQPVFVCMTPVLVPNGYSHIAQAMDMDAAYLYQEAQSARHKAAALRAKAAMQHQMTTDPTADDSASHPKQMMTEPATAEPQKLSAATAEPQQSFVRQGLQMQATEIQLEVQRAQLAAAGLRAQIRLEAVENTKHKQVASDAVEEATSLMLRNIPLDLTREMFLRMIDSEGFAGKYNFVYLPKDFKTSANLGYAFVNSVAHVDAVRMQRHFDGFCRWSLRSGKKCEAVWSSMQGLAAYINRYRNNPVMHESVAEEARPMLFQQGVRVALPAPTLKLKAPRQ